MAFLEIWAIACAVILAYVTMMWLLSLIQDAGVLDGVWGLGFAVAAVTYAVLAGGYGPRKLLVAALYVVWGLRLSAYMLYRNRVSDGRSSNYLKMRERVGRAFWWKSFYQVSLPQAALIALLSTPALPCLTCWARWYGWPVSCLRRPATRNCYASSATVPTRDGCCVRACGPTRVTPTYSATLCCGGASSLSRWVRRTAGPRSTPRSS